MHRPFFYSSTILRGFDLSWMWKDALTALGWLQQDVAGNVTTVVAGLVAAPTAPASLTLNLSAGRIYQQSPIDPAPYGVLPADTTVVQQQGVAPAQSIALSTAGLSAGQSMWALVQAQFSQQDIVRPTDPTGGVESFFNTNNPTQPFQGPNNNGASQPTVREGLVSIAVIFGTPATTGSEAPPAPTGGWVPLYLIDLTFAQSTIVSGQILIAGPSVGANVPSNYPGAPFLAGMLNQHHRGTPGQAPQIDLTDEVKNTLPLANLPASSTSGGGLAVSKIHAGNPNGNLAGNFNVNGTQDFCWDSTNKILYACITTGTTSTAVWQAITGGSTNIFAGGTSTGAANAQVVSSTIPVGFTLTSGNVVTFVAGFANTGSTTLNTDATGAIVIKKNTGTLVNLSGGEIQAGQFITVIYDGTEYVLEAATLGALATLNLGKGVKNDGAGNLQVALGRGLDFDGSNNVEIAASGATAGTYTSPLITIDVTGRVTSIASAKPTLGIFITAAGSFGFTAPVGTISATVFKITLVGGGGGGASSGVNTGGGGGGATLYAWVSGLVAGATYVGTVGTGGGPGSNGGGTAITINGVAYTAGGGGTGVGPAGGVGGVASNGAMDVTGGTGSPTVNAGFGGSGGGSTLGFGGPGSSGVGGNGSGFGGGGGAGPGGAANGAGGIAQIEWVL